ncbi:MAG: hypothetical protein AAB356_00555 [Deltaproteobacteria bacterium]
MPGIILEQDSECVSVRIPMKMKHRGGRKVIIVPDGLHDVASPRSDCNIPLAVAVARAHQWQELFLSGKYATATALARKLGLDRSYVTRMMRLALLAPDIIDAIMDGREPDGLTFKMITVKPVPVSWQEQRKLFGFEEPDKSGTDIGQTESLFNLRRNRRQQRLE